MKYSLNVFAALGKSPSSEDYIRLAERMEALGFLSLWAPDHVAIPEKYDRSQYPYPSGFPEGYNWIEPFVFLGAIASRTKKLLLGTTVAIVPLRAPVQQAQAIAALDLMSDGRFQYGIGLGWMEAEYELLNIPFKERGRRTDEYVQMMKELWSGSTAPFEGQFFSHGGAQLQPLPVQKPHPPIIVGGEGLPAFRRLIKLEGDGLQSVYKKPAILREEYELLKTMMRNTGRKFSELKISMVITDDNIEGLLDRPEEIAEFEDIGVRELVLAPKYSSPQEGMSKVEEIARRMIG